MKCGELIKYLSEFNSEESLRADIERKQACIISAYRLIKEYLPLDDLSVCSEECGDDDR